MTTPQLFTLKDKMQFLLDYTKKLHLHRWMKRIDSGDYLIDEDHLVEATIDVIRQVYPTLATGCDRLFHKDIVLNFGHMWQSVLENLRLFAYQDHAARRLASAMHLECDGSYAFFMNDIPIGAVHKDSPYRAWFEKNHWTDKDWLNESTSFSPESFFSRALKSIKPEDDGNLIIELDREWFEVEELSLSGLTSPFPQLEGIYLPMEFLALICTFYRLLEMDAKLLAFQIGFTSKQYLHVCRDTFCLDINEDTTEISWKEITPAIRMISYNEGA